MNRRELFQRLAAAAPVAAALTLRSPAQAAPAPVQAKPELITYELITSVAIVQQLQRIANRAVKVIDAQTKFPPVIFPHYGIARGNDTGNVYTEANGHPVYRGQVKYDKHMEACCVGNDAETFMADDTSMDMYISPCTLALSEAITKDSVGKNAIQFATLARPLPGCGALSVYGETKRIKIRLTLSYLPERLQQLFVVDCLYGTV